MNISSSIALDALSLVFMAALIFNLTRSHRRSGFNRRYLMLILTVCLFTALDILYMTLYGSTSKVGTVLLLLVKSFYFIMNSTIVLLWARFIIFIIYDTFADKRLKLFFPALFILDTLMVVVNLFTGFMFTITDSGEFAVQAPAMWVFTIVNYVGIIAVIVLIIRNRKKIDRVYLLPFLVFALPPFFAEIFQIFVRRVSLICTYSISAVLIYQSSQLDTIYKDSLTGLGNRRLLDEYLFKWFCNSHGKNICGIMLDLDGLKQTNDTFGHKSGDNALVAAAEVIKLVGRKEIISSRYGGDEFVLVWLSDNPDDADAVLKMLEINRESVNRHRQPHEKIEFSAGCFVCRDGRQLTPDRFLAEIDNSMYEAKKLKRAIRAAQAAKVKTVRRDNVPGEGSEGTGAERQT